MAAWLRERPIGARGFGRIADLAVVASYDFVLARTVGEGQAVANDIGVLTMETM